MSLGNKFETDGKQKAPKNKNIVKILIIAGAVIIVICGVLLGLYLKKNSDYNNAIEMLDDEPQEAAQIFKELGDFKESQEHLLECDYLIALDAFESGEYEEAAGMFEALGDYEDSAEKLEESQNHIKYSEAKILMDEEKYAEALAAFLELGDFLDSARMASKCKMADEYNQAVALMESEDYEGAKHMFEGMPYYKESDYLAIICSYKIMYLDAVQKHKDEKFVEAWELLRDIKTGAKDNEIDFSLVADEEEYTALRDECFKYVLYKTASAHFEDEKYYYAYTNFLNAGVYDWEEKSQQCIQPFESGELYSNPDYSENEATIIFRADSDRTRNLVLKIYLGDNLVSVVAVKPGKRVTVKVPNGIYSIAGGSGEIWFGEKDFFGGDGDYHKLLFPEDQSVSGMRDKKLFVSVFNTIIDIYAEGKTGNTDTAPLTYRQFLDIG